MQGHVSTITYINWAHHECSTWSLYKPPQHSSGGRSSTKVGKKLATARSCTCRVYLCCPLTRRIKCDSKFDLKCGRQSILPSSWSIILGYATTQTIRERVFKWVRVSRRRKQNIWASSNILFVSHPHFLHVLLLKKVVDDLFLTSTSIAWCQWLSRTSRRPAFGSIVLLNNNFRMAKAGVF